MKGIRSPTESAHILLVVTVPFLSPAQLVQKCERVHEEKKNVKKKVIVNKSRCLAAMFLSENSINHFIWSKIHPINTMEAHLRHFKHQDISCSYPTCYLPNIGKVAFYKTASGGHLVLPMWPKINRLPPLSDLKDYAKFENNHRK